MQIRPAKISDARPMARIYVETWQATYRGILPDGYLDTMTIGDSAKALSREMGGVGVVSLVAEADRGHLAGLITGGIDRRRDAIYGGEIFSLYVGPTYQRQGIGKGLVMHLVDRMNQLDIFAVKVQVLQANPCRRFYEKLNGVLLAGGRIRFAGTEIDACTYGWIDTDLIGAVI